ncbi:MAG: acyl-CoA dehydrogenase family protein [Candidatus Eremiobacteraeota bacterium]|nr:acyl-CoA dehydrogenase family protein [Candidatus Eremiobacteraeota bacterium]
MTIAQDNATQYAGGSFLLEDFPPEELFTPDELSEEHRMIRATAERFMLEEVMPNVDRIESKDLDFMRSVLRKAADLGLLGAEIPERYGGLALDLLSLMLIGEQISRLASFSVSFGAHAGIGTAPVLYFGNEQQKSKYLPMLASGELLSSYALTEPHSGSDALAARTKAVLSEDGTHYILNGNKMWITNGGFADLSMVFAKVDGDKFTCFIVETAWEGFAPASEEKKMGLNGSSTTGLVLENVKVPVENVVGEIGKGHKVALNVLNIGRFKLGAWCIAGAKFAINDAISYARERTQFGKHLHEFGAIKQKFGQMLVYTWIGDAMNYRTAGLIDRSLKALDPEDYSGILKGIEEYVIECAVLKVKCSEFLDFVVDECVQIFGGYGYSREYPAERAYRDSRINRIFEGTNEINRLTITGMLLKRAMAGRLMLMDSLMEIQNELEQGVTEEATGGPIGAERALVKASKKATLLAAGLAINTVGFDQPEEKHQEVLMRIADLVMEVFAQDSGWLRCQKLVDQRGEADNALQIDITRVFIHQSVSRVHQLARQLLADVVTDPAELKMHLGAIDRLMAHTPINTVEPLRRLADRAIELGRYPF